MFAIHNVKGINKIESSIEGKHVIIFLLVKPSDDNAEDILSKINYFHHKSDRYCSMYLIGYSDGDMKEYADVIRVTGVDGEQWSYSDSCFIDACDDLKNRLSNWTYSGEPELIILQNSNKDSGDQLDFTGYNYIDINYGIENGYIDSFAKFMERLLNACKSEIEGEKALSKANRSRIKCRNVLEYAIESTPQLPSPVKKIMKDKIFYKTCKTNRFSRDHFLYEG